MKKILSLLLSLIMIVSALPLGVMAEEIHAPVLFDGKSNAARLSRQKKSERRRNSSFRSEECLMLKSKLPPSYIAEPVMIME